jgi:hypothetical protein
MSGIGHLAAGFAAKPAAPKIPLWVFLFAGEINDLLYFLFSAAGIEPRAIIVSMDFTQGVRYMNSVSNPWSHGLFMSVVWSVTATAIAFMFFRDRRASILLGFVVFSHWTLDFVMHSNLPLFLDGSRLIGLGLENSGPGFLFMTIFDLVILAAGIAIYFRTKKRTTTPVR